MNNWITTPEQVEEHRWYAVVRLYRPPTQQPQGVTNITYVFSRGCSMEFDQCWVMGSSQLRVRLQAGDRLLACALPLSFSFDTDCRGPVPDLQHIRHEECGQL